MIDSLIKYNLLGPWNRLLGKRASYQGGRKGVRCLLAQTLSTMASQGWEELAIGTSWLSPEDSESAYVQASYLLHKAHTLWWSYPKNVTYQQLRGLVAERDSEVYLLAVNTTLEEEAFSKVRQRVYSRHHHYRPTDQFGPVSVRQELFGVSDSALCHRLAGCIGFSVLNTSLAQLFEYFHFVLFRHMMKWRAWGRR